MELPEHLNLSFERSQTLRYGENPHQEAALYLDPSSRRPSVARGTQLQGKELSFNNIADADAAFECVAEFSEPAVVIVKHMNPCGVAIGGSTSEAYQKALACDPVSAFGGIVALNRPLDATLARELTKIFLEVVVAPEVDDDARAALADKPNVRVVATGGMPQPGESQLTVRSVGGGVLVQTSDNAVVSELKTATKRAPSAQETADLKFAFTVCKHVKSNAIVYAKAGATLGIGAGQMSRIVSAKIAAMKAAEASLSLAGSVMASDAFFPFPDCVEAAYAAGASAIIQPGGSIKDTDSIAKADEFGMAMLMTGMRHFRH
jgi:phosphoribosylaminoimidazolecarboxamide formyltransferase/IMP cyclohydrolase